MSTPPFDSGFKGPRFGSGVYLESREPLLFFPLPVMPEPNPPADALKLNSVFLLL